jgi:hypothetical protein
MENPNDPKSQHLDLNRHRILEENPYIDETFKVYCRAMQYLMKKMYIGVNVPVFLAKRALFWYDEATPTAHWETVNAIPLLPIKPLGRHYIEILHWMEIESTYSFTNNITKHLQRLELYLEEMEEDANTVIVAPPPPPPVPETDTEVQPDFEDDQQAQNLDDLDFILYDDNYRRQQKQQELLEFQNKFIVPWLKQLQELEDRKVIPYRYFLQTQGQAEFQELMRELREMTPLELWLFHVQMALPSIELAERCLYYRDGIVNTNSSFSSYSKYPLNPKEGKPFREKIKKEHNLMVMGMKPLEFSIPIRSETRTEITTYNRQLNTPMLVQGYYNHFQMNRVENPLRVLTMRHDLHMRHFYQQSVHDSHLWTLLYTMYGDMVQPTACQVFDDPNLDQRSHRNFSGDCLLALTVGLLSNNYDWWSKVSHRASAEMLAQSLVFAISRGMFPFLDKWRKENRNQFTLALQTIHNLNRSSEDLVLDEDSPTELDLCHYMFHYAVVFQQFGVLQWLKKIYGVYYKRWDELLPVQVLVTQATVIQYDVELILNTNTKSAHSRQGNSAIQNILDEIRLTHKLLQVKRNQDMVQINVVNELEFSVVQEVEEHILESILASCEEPAKIYHRQLSCTFLFWLFFLDQIYINMNGDRLGPFPLTHIGMKGMKLWQLIVDHLITTNVLSLSDRRRRIELTDTDGDVEMGDDALGGGDALPPSHLNAERPSLIPDTDAPYIFSVPRSLQKENSNRIPQSPEGERDADNAPQENSVTIDWRLPTLMEIHPVDDQCKALLSFLMEEGFAKNSYLASVLDRVTNILDIYRVFLVPPGRVFQWSKFDPPSRLTLNWAIDRDPLLTNQQKLDLLEELYGKRIAPIPAPSKPIWEMPENQLGLDPDPYTTPEFLQNHCHFEVFILSHLESDLDMNIFYPLLTLAAFLRVRESDELFRIAYFLPIFEKRKIKHSAISPLWYKGTALDRLERKVDSWQVYQNQTAMEEVFLDDLDRDRTNYYNRRIDRLKQSMLFLRYSVYQQQTSPPSHVGASVALCEQGHTLTQQPLIGLFFHPHRPFMAHHTSMEFTPILSTSTDKAKSSLLTDDLKNKRNRQIQIGKATPAYLNYRIHIPLDTRVLKQDLERYPVTPRCNTPQVPSRAVWNQLVTRWRARIHHQYHPGASSVLNLQPGSHFESEPAPLSMGYLSSDYSSSGSGSDIKSPRKNPQTENELHQWEVYYYDLQQEEYANTKSKSSQLLQTQIDTKTLINPLLGIDLDTDNILGARDQEKAMNHMVSDLLQSQ